LKLCGYIYHQGTYTHQAGTEKSAAFLLLTGVRSCTFVVVQYGRPQCFSRVSWNKRV